MSRQFTIEQQAAIRASAPRVVLSSGAGCGKTSVLTECYLERLRQGAAVSQIAAITFTERAAREMRKRIREAVVRVRADAPLVWDQHLRDLETATICTIHSFCAGLLRQYALVVGIDPQFEVLEEAFALNLREEMVNAALQNLLTDRGPATEALADLISVFGWYDVQQTIHGLIRSPETSPWMAWAERSATEIVSDWRSAHSDIVGRCIEHGLRHEPAVANCLSLLRRIQCPGPKMAERVVAIFGGMKQLASAANPTKLLAHLREKARVQGAEPGKKWRDQQEYEAVKTALADFREALSGLVPTFSDDDGALAAADVGRKFVQVASVCREAFRDAKKHNRVLDFHDLLLFARNLVRDQPKVAAALRRRYRFILLDELQDTDPVQMQLIEMLSSKLPSRFFAVGDKKQSIYRFRGADVRQFDRLQASAPENGRLSLTRNFRTQPAVIQFVNALFRQHIADYEPLQPQRAQITEEPCVMFLWSNAAGLSAEKGRAADARRIAREISRWVSTGQRLVVDRETEAARPLRLGDIAILFRKMTNVAIYEHALRAAEIDYHLIGGRAYFAQQEIYDLLNVLRAVENPLDGLSLAGTLRSPLIGLSDDGLVVLSQHPGGIWRGLHDAATVKKLPADDRPVAERAGKQLQHWRTQKDRLPIAGLINLIVSESGYDAALQFEHYGDRKLANLWKLIDLARTFDQAGRFHVADFIHRLAAATLADTQEEQAATLPEESDVVRIMTIHQAKGLEFPVVILPDLGAQAGGAHSARAIWDDELGCVVRPPRDLDPPDFSGEPWELWQRREKLADWDEELRTFYVACTRAMDHLVLAGSLYGSNCDSTALTVLENRFDLQSGACRDQSIGNADQPNVYVVADADAPVALAPRQRSHVEALTEADWLQSQALRG